MFNNLYFCFHVQFRANDTYWLLDHNRSPEEFRRSTENFMEPVLQQMGNVQDFYFILDNQDKGIITYLFQIVQRKRIARLRNLIEKHVTLDHLMTTNVRSLRTKAERPYLQTCDALSKTEFEKIFFHYQKQKRFLIRMEKPHYKGADITVLNDPKNWYEWQKKLYDLLFDKNGEFRKAKVREIIFIEDNCGNSGKSIFWKWLYLKNNSDIGFLYEGRASQIKANIFKLGPKKLYIIDLPKTPSEIGTIPLINAIEELKNGMVTRLGKVMIMPSPWIILTGRDISMSLLWRPDRLVVYSINNDEKKDWTDISEERRKRAQEDINLEIKRKKIITEVKKIKMKKAEESLKNSEGN